MKNIKAFLQARPVCEVCRKKNLFRKSEHVIGIGDELYAVCDECYNSIMDRRVSDGTKEDRAG